MHSDVKIFVYKKLPSQSLKTDTIKYFPYLDTNLLPIDRSKTNKSSYHISPDLSFTYNQSSRNPTDPILNEHNKILYRPDC